MRRKKMFYEKNGRKQLSDKLFENPTSEYRATPFWAWNDNLDKDDLLWQIEQLKKMGFGGFHMHVRCGMATPYLGDEFMNLVKECANKAEKEKMLAYLYDEDRWPSGAAGGMVTKNHEYRQRTLVFTADLQKFGLVSDKDGTANENGENKSGYIHPVLLATYDVCLDKDGYLSSYKRINAGETAKGEKRYAVMVSSAGSGWYNGESYIDTMNPEAVAQFIKITHEKYYKELGDKFGKTVPSIFTDEPQLSKCSTLSFAFSKEDVTCQWTPALPQKFREKYGFDILDRFPEVIWDKKCEPATVRYYFHDFVCELFTRAFSDRIGAWCDKHNIALTGHMMHEPTLESQTEFLGETMRAYRGFDIPGIDMLCDNYEYTTAKQCQSAVNQLGREGMMSELYGVTGWDFDFKGHKSQGDWQAALGVTVRVPHLSWVSMRGSAKRDYPASISYQSEWYKNYPYVENHFARVNTAMTRGAADVKVAVIHPIESYWLAYGPNQTTAAKRAQLKADFDNVINWLLFGTIDFDYISESLLPDLYEESDKPVLKVGKMSYSAVVVAGADTLRSTTINALQKFAENGGTVIFLGGKPQFADGKKSDAVDKLYSIAEHCEFAKQPLLSALSEFRDVKITDNGGVPADEYIYRKRKDGGTEWLFIARGRKVLADNRKQGHNDKKTLRITLKGIVTPVIYNTITGKTEPANFYYENDNTVVVKDFYRFDSLLLKLENGRGECSFVAADNVTPDKTEEIRTFVEYKSGEKNVLVLDMPEWSADGKEYMPREEMLRVDLALRRRYDYPLADGRDVQPWVIGEVKPEKKVYLRFKFNSGVRPLVKLATEGAEKVWLNGAEVSVNYDGYFTDKRIYTMPLGRLKKGENEIVALVPFGKRTSLENMFVLGEFGVKTQGERAEIIAKPKTVAFGDLTRQGFPFYGADFTYKIPLNCEKDCDVKVSATLFDAAVVTAKIDGKDAGIIAWCPYSIEIKNLKSGKHELELTAHVSRVNTFGGLHACLDIPWKGPNYWYTHGAEWAYEYQLKETGILKSPVIKYFNKK